MWGKEKISKSLSIGVLSLSFVMLFSQFALFAVRVVEVHRYNVALLEDSLATGQDTVRRGFFVLDKLPPKPSYPQQRPKVELNSADTTALKTLYGIGSYYARKIVEFREKIGSFANCEQLMDVYGIDSARFVSLRDRIYVDTSLIVPIDLYRMPLDSMSRHPYIGRYAARGIERYRRTVDSASFSIDALVENGILHPAYAQRLKLYRR